MIAAIRSGDDNAIAGGGVRTGTGASGTSPVIHPGVGVSPTAAQYMMAPPPVSSGAPAPRPASPAAMTSVNPALGSPGGASTPAPAPQGLIPVASGITNHNTGQTAPNVGTPQGYNVSQGIDTSMAGLLPSGFNLGTLTAPALPDAATPSASSYIQQGKAQMEGPTNWNVTADQTVAGQFAKLMQAGNPAIQAVEEQTLRAHAASGGRNDLMAQSAATLTGSQVALSIAAQDAQTYAAAGQFNANAANTFAQQMDQFIGNALLSKQNFDQGVAMLKDQTNQNLEELYGQVQANAATQSTNLKSTLATLQGQTNATLEQMDKQFSQSVATLNLQHQFTSEEQWQQYGQNVRMSYLSGLNTQQTALMQAIGSISGNPNITAAQAQAAVGDAIDQFNSYVTMNNAYYASMVPGTTAGATGGTYGSAAYDYSIA